MGDDNTLNSVATDIKKALSDSEQPVDGDVRILEPVVDRVVHFEIDVRVKPTKDIITSAIFSDWIFRNGMIILIIKEYANV